jgi:predicted DNA binding CopG/RHH family protein
MPAALSSPPAAAAEDAAPAAKNRFWDEGKLAKDVVSLSYESAIGGRTRDASVEGVEPAIASNGRGTAGAPRPRAIDTRAIDTTNAGNTADAADAAEMTEEWNGTERPARQQPPELDLRTSSVTIRLSQGECARLRRRASEAGMTVSAYLRSCVLEADSLRAQVKVALGELRRASTSATGNEPHAARTEPRRSSGWLARLFQRRRARSLNSQFDTETIEET